MLKRVLAIAVIGAAALTSVGACASDYGPGAWGSGYRYAAPPVARRNKLCTPSYQRTPFIIRTVTCASRNTAAD